MKNKYELTEYLFSDFLSISTEKVGELEVPEYSVTNGGIIPRSEKFDKKLSKSSAKNKLIKRGYLIFGNSRTVLNWGLMRDDIGSVSAAYNVFKVDESKVNPYYLQAYIRCFIDDFMNIIKPGIRDNQGIDKDILLSKTILVPELGVQKKFELIEKARKSNEKESKELDNLCSTIYKKWFLNIDNDSELQEIEGLLYPKAWKVLKFSDFTCRKTEKIGEVKAPVYSTTNFGLSVRNKNLNQKSDLSVQKNKKIVKGDLLFGLSREILNFGVMKESIGSVSPAYEVYSVDSSVYIPEILEMEIRNRIEQYHVLVKPGAREGQGIDKTVFEGRSVAIPDRALQERFLSFYQTIKEKKANLLSQNLEYDDMQLKLVEMIVRG